MGPGIRRRVDEADGRVQTRNRPESECRGRQRQRVLLREAPKDRGAQAKVVVHADIALIPTLAEDGIGDLVVRQSRSIWKRIGLDKPASDGIESGFGDHASGERIARETTCGSGGSMHGEWITDRSAAGEVP